MWRVRQILPVGNDDTLLFKMILSIQLDSEKLDLLTASNKSIGNEPGFFSVD
jgi:hypothetical protein